MNEIIETLGMTLLWEVVSNKVECIEELPNILYDDISNINGVEIIDSDSFIIDNYTIDDKLTVNFEMPFIMMLDVDGVQRYRLQANAVGVCNTPYPFEYDINDLTSMDKNELLSYSHLVNISLLTYQDIEIDSII